MRRLVDDADRNPGDFSTNHLKQLVGATRDVLGDLESALKVEDD